MSTVSICLAGVGGALSATGANVQAYAKHCERQSGVQLSTLRNYLSIVACLVLNLTGIGLFAAATATGGAVATVMPLQTGSNLLVNMFWQMRLGMKHFNKSMRLGTIILVCAVGQLGELGPNEPADMDIKELMSELQAIAWVAIMVVGTFLAIFGSWLTRDRPVESFAKLACLTSAVSLTTVLGSSISKNFGSEYLTAGEKLAAFVLYFVDGVLCMSFTVIANSGCDVSIYIPLQLSSQLVLNMITGYLVWGDAKYVDRPVSYILSYFLCVLGVYLISPEVDAVGDFVRVCNIRRSRLSSGIAYSSLGKAFVRVMDMWERQCMTLSAAPLSEQDAGGDSAERAPSSDSELEAELADTLQEVLKLGLETGAIKQKEIVALVMQYLKQMRFRPNETVINWLFDCEHFRRYLQHDPAFRDRLKDIFTDDELRTILVLNEASPPCLSSSQSLALPLTGNSFENITP